MRFFDVRFSKDNRIFRIEVSILMRILFSFISLLFLLVYVFAFEPGEFSELGILNKIVLILLFGLSLIGIIFRNRLVFNKDVKTIEIQKGLIFLYKKNKFEFKDFRGIVKKTYQTPKISNMFRDSGEFDKLRYYLAFHIGDKFFLIEKDLKKEQFDMYVNPFKLYWEEDVHELM